MKSLGIHPWLFPQPVYMIGTYNDDDTVNQMMMAWGGIVDYKMVALNIAADHQTCANLRRRKAFTLAVPGVDTLEASDYFGMVSGRNVPDKFERTGLHAVKSDKVDAPIVSEYPVTLECVLVEEQQQPYGLRFLGEIVDVKADERVLDGQGKIDAEKLHAFVFDMMKNGYYEIGGKCGNAWKSGGKFK
jgi:flavin reductase (DIM6/NTAB) family NADH-FMN oxidoreductase RutF